MSKTCNSCKQTLQDHEMVPDGTVEGTEDERPRVMDDQGRLCDSEVRVDECKQCRAMSCPFTVCEGCWEIYGPLDYPEVRAEVEIKTIKVIKIFPAPALVPGRYPNLDLASSQDYEEDIARAYYCHACAQERNLQENSIIYA